MQGGGGGAGGRGSGRGSRVRGWQYSWGLCVVGVFFFFNDTATTEIYTLSLHDALPIYLGDRARRLGLDLVEDLHRLDDADHRVGAHALADGNEGRAVRIGRGVEGADHRSEEHTSELQSHSDLVCRLLLEKKKKKKKKKEEKKRRKKQKKKNR